MERHDLGLLKTKKNLPFKITWNTKLFWWINDFFLIVVVIQLGPKKARGLYSWHKLGALNPNH